ncbi:MAG: ABC transporter substrate-binding protein [Lachnospiraceae bacterium]|nr:ABC transporter substrate-binding protein [Lachnospiraceae bacterium]
MKKVLAMLLAAGMIFSMTACGAKTEAPAEEKKETVEENTEAVEENVEGTEEMDGAMVLISEGKLVMATNAQFPPYELVSDGEGVDGTGFEGIDIEIAMVLAEKLGLELQIDDMDFDAALMAVQEGKCDVVLAGLTYTEERDQIMDFSDSYAQGVQVIIVNEDSAIKSVDDLANADQIGTQRGTTGYIYCCDDYGDDHVAAYDNGASAVQALKNGQVDAVVIDKAPALEYVGANEGLVILDTEYVVEDYCVAMAEGNRGLQAAINVALNELIEDGTVDAIIEKYIKA